MFADARPEWRFFGFDVPYVCWMRVEGLSGSKRIHLYRVFLPKNGDVADVKFAGGLCATDQNDCGLGIKRMSTRVLGSVGSLPVRSTLALVLYFLWVGYIAEFTLQFRAIRRLSGRTYMEMTEGQISQS